MKTYSRLSQVYDLGWGDFSKQYVGLVNGLLQERSITRARILDLACGTGTLAIELAHSGHFVHGLDISPEMIDIAQSKSSRLLNVSFEVADMTRFQVEGKFDLVSCTFDSINYLMRTSDLRAMLSRVARSLNHAGLFVFDSNTRRLYRSYQRERLKRELGGQSFIQYCTYDPIKNKAMVEFTFSDGTLEVHKQRPYELRELKPLLSAAGLNMVRVFSWFDSQPYSSKTEKLFCVAEKCEPATNVSHRLSSTDSVAG